MAGAFFKLTYTLKRRLKSRKCSTALASCMQGNSF